MRNLTLLGNSSKLTRLMKDIVRRLRVIEMPVGMRQQGIFYVYAKSGRVK